MFILESLHNVFLDTTDPDTDYSRLFSLDVFFSIVLHLILYSIVYLGLIYFFNIPDHFFAFIIVLFVVMGLGYIGRLARVKSIYSVLMYKNNSTDSDAETEESNEKIVKETAVSTIRNSYFTWYFLG